MTDGAERASEGLAARATEVRAHIESLSPFDLRAFLRGELGVEVLESGSAEASHRVDAMLAELLAYSDAGKAPRRLSFNTAIVTYAPSTDLVRVSHDLYLDLEFEMSRDEFVDEVKNLIAESRTSEPGSPIESIAR